MDKINKSDVYWAAGFFQGEGFAGISLAKRKYKEDYQYVMLKITQYNDRTPLDKFQEIFSYGSVQGPYTNNRGESEIYQYSASSNEAESILNKILPALTGKKYIQVKNILDKINLYRLKDRPMPKGKKTHCPKGHDYSVSGYTRPNGYVICKTCHAEHKRNMRKNAK
jgi:hypothetical protein